MGLTVEAEGLGLKVLMLEDDIPYIIELSSLRS